MSEEETPVVSVKATKTIITVKAAKMIVSEPVCAVDAAIGQTAAIAELIPAIKGTVTPMVESARVLVSRR
jgi:hypothetical protein